MSSNIWEYFVPYQPDLEKALHDLRQQLFAAGDYYLYIDLEPANEEAYVEREYDLGINTLEQAEQARQYFREQEKNPRPSPKSVDELIDWCGKKGTHTIIDIRYFTDDPECNDLFTAIPLAETQLLELFGTTKPTHSMIAKEQKLWLLHGWRQATYITLYENDIPAEVYFVGSSGS